MADEDEGLRKSSERKVFSEFGEGRSGVEGRRKQCEVMVLSFVVDLEVNEVELGCAD